MSLTMLCCALLASLAAATVVAPAGFAQSAGDEQYVDPFGGDQGNDGGGGGGGGGRGGNAGSGGGNAGSRGGNTGAGGRNTGAGTGSGSGGVEEQPSVPETPAAEAPADTSGVTAPAESDSTGGTGSGASAGRTLPRTGLPLLALFGAGVLLVAGGFLLRRHA
jgi:hypothetical protein